MTFERPKTDLRWHKHGRDYALQNHSFYGLTEAVAVRCDNGRGSDNDCIDFELPALSGEEATDPGCVLEHLGQLVKIQKPAS